MAQSSRNGVTSKHIGCTGGQPSTADSIVQRVLDGFTYLPGTAAQDAAQTKRDRQEMLHVKIAQLQNDIKELTDTLDEYETEYGPLPSLVIETVEAAGWLLTDWAHDHDEQWHAWCAMQERIEQDDAWQMRQYASDSIAGGHEE